ncbi:MAG: energy transducer TonB [Bacteroidales bacterium]|nr:energy transducer TonB [Bacteroidales bacterium]
MKHHISILTLCLHVIFAHAQNNIIDYVDLGLSVKWATCNIGANRSEENGYYFAWGETKPKSCYDKNSYKFRGYLDNFDAPDILDKEKDVATVLLGGNWHIPTKNEWMELFEKCSWQRTIIHGVKGYKVVSSNGNSIFLPLAGRMVESNLYNEGILGYYWSSTAGYSPYNDAFSIHLSAYNNTERYESCYMGLSIRPVYTQSLSTKDNMPTENNIYNSNTLDPNSEYVMLADGTIRKRKSYKAKQRDPEYNMDEYFEAIKAEVDRRNKEGWDTNVTTDILNDETNEEVLFQTDIMPSFPGGIDALMNFVYKNIEYPEESSSNGYIVIRFVVNKQGKAVQPEIIKSDNPTLARALLNLTDSFPTFNPGEKAGKKVPVYFYLPILFK